MSAYRVGPTSQCLICKQGPLEPDGDGFRCPNGCGLWDPTIPRPDRKSLAKHGRRVEDQVHPRTCPVCAKTMEIRRWSGLTYDVCAGHGVWVAGDDIDYYRQLTG
jgi:hypothetical protein